jgi:hypothetical protein
VGLKIVGEMLSQESNRVTLADDVDQHGLRIPRITYSWCDNDKRLIDHSLKFMTRQSRPAPMSRAIPPNQAAQRGQNWKPMRGSNLNAN